MCPFCCSQAAADDNAISSCWQRYLALRYCMVAPEAVASYYPYLAAPE